MRNKRKIFRISNIDMQKELAIDFALFLIEKKATIRQVAKSKGFSKSKVHVYLKKLQYLEPHLFLQVNEILQKNKEERHIRGGMATKLKYINDKNTAHI